MCISLHLIGVLDDWQLAIDSIGSSHGSNHIHAGLSYFNISWKAVEERIVVWYGNRETVTQGLENRRVPLSIIGGAARIRSSVGFNIINL